MAIMTSPTLPYFAPIQCENMYFNCIDSLVTLSHSLQIYLKYFNSIYV